MVNTTNEGLTGGLVFIRHGESENNVQKIYNSDPKNPAYQPVGLTATGREQVLATSRRLLSQGIDGHTIGQVLISPLPRTIATAAIVMDVLSIPSDKSKVELRATEQRMGERKVRVLRIIPPGFLSTLNASVERAAVRCKAEWHHCCMTFCPLGPESAVCLDYQPRQPTACGAGISRAWQSAASNRRLSGHPLCANKNA